MQNSKNISAPKLVQQDNFTLKPAKTQTNYFDHITERLDAWDSKQQAIKSAHAQLTKSMIVKETDPLTGVTRTYRLSCELLSTELANPLEFDDLNCASLESEASSYAN